MEPLAQGILNFWFGPLDANGLVAKEKSDRWFQKDAAFDQEIRKKFEEYLQPAAWGAFDRWNLHDDSRVALLVLLDQFPRNIYRNDPKSFYFDQKALHISMEGIHSEHFLRVPVVYAYFSIMPTMHAESLEAQETGIAAFERLLQAAAPGELKEMLASALDYAKRHRDIIAQFGRFPHRNAILGRDSRKEELEFLQQPGSSF
ncbi:MAG: DUF924 family protein [Oligoflexus sp.]